MSYDILARLDYTNSLPYFPLFPGQTAPAMQQSFATICTNLEKLMQPFIDQLTQLPDHVINILSIGGRYCPELAIILKIFLKLPHKQLNFVMVDLDAQGVAGFNILYKHFLGNKVRAICADANTISDQKFHGIIMRHPQFKDDGGKPISGTQQLITSAIPRLLSPSGTFYLSFYHAYEKDIFLKLSTQPFPHRKITIQHNPRGSYVVPAANPRLTDLIFDQYTAIMLG